MAVMRYVTLNVETYGYGYINGYTKNENTPVNNIIAENNKVTNDYFKEEIFSQLEEAGIEDQATKQTIENVLNRFAIKNYEQLYGSGLLEQFIAGFVISGTDILLK